jgi:hypothetical protein
MNTRKIRTMMLGAAAVFAAGILAVACTGKKSGGDVPDPRCDEAVVPYEGKATDEACKTMLDAEDAGQVVSGTVNATIVVLPSNGQSIAATASALTITWTSPIDADGDVFLFDHRAPKNEKLAFGAARHDRGMAHDIARQLVEMINPISTAWAHLPPITGALHMVRITGITGRTTPFLLFTTALHTMLVGSNLSPILATSTPMDIQLTSAYMTENRIVTPSTDGPFRATTATTIHVN